MAVDSHGPACGLDVALAVMSGKWKPLILYHLQGGPTRFANSDCYSEHAEGCAFLDGAQDVSDPATFHLVEGWRDQAALDAHGASAEFQAVLKDAATLGVVDLAIDIYSVSRRQTVNMPL